MVYSRREREIDYPWEDILEKEFRKFDLQQAKLIKSGELAKVASEFSFQGVEDLIAAVGYGKITANQIIGKILPQEKLDQQKEELKEGRFKSLVHKITRSPKDALLIKGIDNVMVRYAGCCNPVPGDKVVGFITRGRGVTIHTADCQSAMDDDPLRKVEVEWNSTKEYSYPVRRSSATRASRSRATSGAAAAAESASPAVARARSSRWTSRTYPPPCARGSAC